MIPDPDRVRAVLYGSVLGDAAGLPHEMRTRAQIEARGGVADDLVASSRSNGESFAAGEGSDDTEQTLIVLDLFLEQADSNEHAHMPDERRFAQRLIAWAATAKGMGTHTRNVLHAPGFADDPWRVSERVWRERGGTVAPNGAVMRTAIVGALRPWDDVWTVQTAYRLAMVTHYSDLCRAAARDVTLAVAGFLTGRVEEGLRGLPASGSLAGLDEAPMGETTKPVQAAAYAARCATDFWSGIREVVAAGGDTDTNAAVAGAVLGARFGIGGEHGIPQRLIDSLHDKPALDRRLDRLLAAHRLEATWRAGSDHGGT